MKTLTRCLAVLFCITVAGIFAGCNPGGAGVDNGTNGGGAVSRSVKLNDANGHLLGFVTASDPTEVTIFTSKSYFVTLYWSGTLKPTVVYFTGPNGQGTMFTLWANTYPLWGYVAVYQGHPYVVTSIDASGFAIADPSITAYQSYCFDGVNITNSSGSLASEQCAYDMKQVQLADLGLPTSIATPMRMVFE